MSGHIKTTTMANNWIDFAIANNYIHEHPHGGFRNIKYNGDTGGMGRFSDVASADWPRANRKVALKKLKNFNLDNFVSEVIIFSRLVCSQHPRSVSQNLLIIQNR
jgi:hypothetical protein